MKILYLNPVTKVGFSKKSRQIKCYIYSLVVRRWKDIVSVLMNKPRFHIIRYNRDFFIKRFKRSCKQYCWQCLILCCQAGTRQSLEIGSYTWLFTDTFVIMIIWMVLKSKWYDMPAMVAKIDNHFEYHEYMRSNIFRSYLK